MPFDTPETLPRCHVYKCSKPVKMMAYGRLSGGPHWFCEKHANSVICEGVNLGGVEQGVKCPCCYTHFGV